MPVDLPVLDAAQDGTLPSYEDGGPSMTQKTLEEAMWKDFPTVAMLGLEIYAERLMRVDYTDGTCVFYLDWKPDLPGYTVVYMKPWTTTIGDDEVVYNKISYCTGLEAAKRAEEIRRCIPPE